MNPVIKGKAPLLACAIAALVAVDAHAETWVPLEPLPPFGAWEEIDKDSVSQMGPEVIEFRTRGRMTIRGAVLPEPLYWQTLRVDCNGLRRAVVASSLGPPASSELEEVILGSARHAKVINACKLASLPVGAFVPRTAPLPPHLPTAPALPERQRSTGSGFIVGPRVVVTNFHVIDGCKALKVRWDSETIGASVRASSERNDLAAVLMEKPLGTSASLRGSALLGEDVVVAGHPLAGVLASDLIVTSGQVNSLAGLSNDPNLLQISAPVQPGNSGGPMIDRTGAIVGVVVSKLNVERLAKITGDLAQNVNFAIKPEVLRLFLDANRIPYRTAGTGKRLEGYEIAERARSFTVQVICD